MEEDDSMEIDETMPAAPIIERRSDEFTPTTVSLSEKDSSTQNTEEIREPITNSNAEKEKEGVQVPDNSSVTTSTQPEKSKSGDKQVDVVILDDDDDEPMKTADGNVC